MNPPDTMLLERWIAQRDPEAMALIVSRYSAMVYATCKRVTRNATDAEDIAQECFLKLSSVQRAGTSLPGLLHTMATRLALNRARGDARRRAREAEYTALSNDAPEASWEDIQPLIDEAIAALPDERGTVIIRHFLRGETHAEIAEDLGLTRAAVSKRVARGVEEVREALRRRGVIASVASLGTMLAVAGAEALPAGLAASLGRLAVSGAGQRAAAMGGMGAGWIKVAAGAALIAAGAMTFMWRSENQMPGSAGTQRTAEVISERGVSSGVDLKTAPAAARATEPIDAGPVAPFEAPVGEGVIQVYATDRVGLPAAGALVTVWREGDIVSHDEAPVGGAIEDSGRLAIRELPWGKYVVKAERGETMARIAVTLSTERPLTQAELVLKRGGDIHGIVADIHGLPVSGAAVQLMDARWSSEAPAKSVTDGEGTFALEEIPLGRYRVRVTAEGFAPLNSAEFGIDDPSLNMKLLRGGSLEGIVRFAASQLPAPRVALQISAPDFDGMERNITTDERGRFSADVLPPGLCYVLSVDNRYAFTPVRAEIAIADGRLERVEFTIDDAAQISGTITDGTTGEPITGVVVYAQDTPSKMHSWKSAPTESDGCYTILGISAGDCEVSANSFPTRYSGGGYDLRRPVSLQPGETRDGIDFQFVSGAIVEGDVVDEEGYPVPRATVLLEPSGPDGATRPPWPSVTDAFGKFCFVDVGRSFSSMNEEGVLEYNMDGTTVVLRAAFRNMRSKDSGPLPLPAEGISGLRLQLNPEPAGAIAGFAVDESGRPANARIYFERLEGRGRFSAGGASTDVDGFFLSKSLEAGTYGLQISPREDHVLTVSLAEGQRVTDLRIVVEAGGNITGRVTDTEGRPVHGVSVSASDEVVRYNDAGVGFTSEAQSAYTDGEGRFTLENLEVGEYRVSTGYEILNGGSWQGMASTGDDLEIVLPPLQETDTEP